MVQKEHYYGLALFQASQLWVPRGVISEGDACKHVGTCELNLVSRTSILPTKSCTPNEGTHVF